MSAYNTRSQNREASEAGAADPDAFSIIGDAESDQAGELGATAQTEHTRGAGVTPARAEGHLSIAATYELLREQLKEKRMLEEISKMRAELNGETPAEPARIDGIALPTRKRAATARDSNPLKHLKLTNPPTFSGKTLKELNNYELAWKLYLDATQFAPEAHEERITAAATGLRDSALHTWSNHDTTKVNTWDEYITVLRGTVVDPTNRVGNATLALTRKRQGRDQTVREFLEEVQDIENELPPMDENARKAWVLLNGLSPDLRTDVMREHTEIKSREQVLKTAQRIEELNKQRARTEAYRPRPSSKDSRAAGTPQARRNYGAKDTREEGERRPSSRKSDNCYKCNQLGHYAKNCPRGGSHDRSRQAASVTLPTRSFQEAEGSKN